MNLAAMTFSILKAPYGDPAVQPFDDVTPDVFREAEETTGFIDRARPIDDVAWMTNFQKDWGRWGPFAVPRFYNGGVAQGHTTQAQTLSLWRDIPALRSFAYRGKLHQAALGRSGEWFGPQNWPIYCIWWTDHQPDWQEACRRLEHLHDHGPTPFSFTLAKAFDAAGSVLKPSAAQPAG